MADANAVDVDSLRAEAQAAASRLASRAGLSEHGDVVRARTTGSTGRPMQVQISEREMLLRSLKESRTSAMSRR